MSTIKTKGKNFRYRDMAKPVDLNHCYLPTCKDQGKPLVDYVARWEKISAVDTSPADAAIFTCADHIAGFEEAKQAFSLTQKSRSAAYLTLQEIENFSRQKRLS